MDHDEDEVTALDAHVLDTLTDDVEVRNGVPESATLLTHRVRVVLLQFHFILVCFDESLYLFNATRPTSCNCGSIL